MSDKIHYMEPTMFQRGVGVFLGLMLCLLIIHLIRTNKLKERLALPWLFSGVAIILLSLFSPILRFLTELIGAGTPLTFLFSMSIFFIVINSIFLATRLSKLVHLVQELTIHNALLKNQIEELEAGSQDSGSTGSEGVGSGEEVAR